MIENLYMDRTEQRLNLYFNKNGLSQERNEFLAYKGKTSSNVSNNKLLEFKVLELLESLGFSSNDVGTYLYGNIVVKIINILQNADDELDVEKLMVQLSRPYSQFFIDIARYEFDMGTKTFHEHISNALLKVNRCKNSKLVKLLSRLDFGNQVFIVAEYVYSRLDEIENFCVEEYPVHQRKLVSKFYRI